MPPKKPPITKFEDLSDALANSLAGERKHGLDQTVPFFSSLSEENEFLKENDYNHLFVQLFRTPSLDWKSLAPDVTGSKSANLRFEAYSDAVRALITFCVAKLKKPKVVTYVIDHLMDVLSADYIWMVPKVIANHLRSLNTMLGHSPHVETLTIEDARRGNRWLKCADFILTRMASVLKEIKSSTSGLEVFGQDSSLPGTYSARLETISQMRGSSEQQQRELALLLQCLNSMLSAPTAPCMEWRGRIAEAVFDALRLRLTRGQMQKFAFAILNCLLVQAASNDPNLGRMIATEVIPLIGYWWQSRASVTDEYTSSFRDEILKTIHAIHLHLEDILRKTPSATLSSQLEDLLDTLWNEYSQRSQQARLGLDDLTFSSLGLPAGHLRTSTFALRPFLQDAERRWVVLETVSRLEHLFARCSDKSSQQVDTADSNDDSRRKRRRFLAGKNRIHQKLLSPNLEVTLTALQLIPFFLTCSTANEEEVVSIVDDLIPIISNKTGMLSSWAMIACASAAMQPHARQESMTTRWKQVWQFAARSLTIPTTSRAACVLLNAILDHRLLPHHALIDDTNNIITASDVCGPSVLSDSSLVLMRRLADLRNELVPSAMHKTSSHVIRWVFASWKPADATTALVHAANMMTIDLVNLLLVCCGLTPLDGVGFTQLVGGHVHQYWQSIHEVAPLTKYLLLLEDNGSAKVDQTHPRPPEDRHVVFTADEIGSSSSHSLATVVLELLIPKADELSQYLESIAQPVSKHSTATSITLSPERLTSLLGCLVSSTILLPHLQNMESGVAADFRVLLDSLWEKCFTLALDSTQYQEPLELVILSVAPYLPLLESAKLAQFCVRHPLLLSICARLSELIQRQYGLSTASKEPDSMDLDDEFDSSSNRPVGPSEAPTLPRPNRALCMSTTAFLESAKAKLHLLAEYFKDEKHIGRIPEAFMDDILNLPNDNFILAQQFVRELSQSDLTNAAVFAKVAIERTGKLQEKRASETVRAMWVDILLSSAPYWSLTQDDSEYCAPFIDLYNYLVKLAWPNGLLSTELQILFANLLFRLIELKSMFWKDKAAKVDNPKRTLLMLLRRGNLVVKFHIAQRLPDLFALTTIREHDTMIVEVMDSLPQEEIDDVAIRVLAVAILGCKMPTLLRWCVWYVIEAPQMIAESARYATFAINTIAVARALDSPQGLFRLFAPQLLYTWLVKESVEKIPFGIFGFSSLNDLLADIQIEAAAIMVMRGQHEALDDLASRLQVTTESLVQKGFAKMTAYSIAWDLSHKTTSAAESLIRNITGKEPFLELVYHNFADIIGIWFTIVDPEADFENYWRKDEVFSYAADNMQAVTSFSQSPTPLPPNQQPSFRGKSLTRQIQHLVKKTNFDIPAFWTPPLVVSVARRLLNTMHPALGPHHALSVVRQIRLLVCIADQEATSMYPLEMLLRSMRPFISDPECADDALGISQWLITNGSGHLSRNPSFVAGYALSTLADLRMFLESSQASSSQESQFKETITKAQQFHSWFVRWLKEYKTSHFQSESQAEAFKAITSSASNIRTSGNSQKDTHESTLLLAILKDAESDDQLLKDSSRDLALKMLCGDFKMPSSNSNDILRADKDARTHGAMVWKSCQAVDSSREYLTWAGRAVGRSFAASGDIPRDVLRESRLSTYRKMIGRRRDSINGLLRLLGTLATSDDSNCAGLAESVLRTIVSYATRVEDRDLLRSCDESLSRELFRASDWSRIFVPLSDYDGSNRALHDPFGRGQILSPSWAEDLCFHLARISPEKGLLYGLSPVFDKVDSFAQQALPYMVHLTLAVEDNNHRPMKDGLSAAVKEWLQVDAQEAVPNIKLLLNVVLYLRDRPYNGEDTVIAKSQWLQIDYLAAAHASVRCGMFRAALLFAELAVSEQTSRGSSRRSSAVRDVEDSSDLLLQIFENIDDPDAYYGLERTASLSNVLARLEYEKEGGKSIAFRGAQYDTHLRTRDPESWRDGQALVQIFSGLGLAGLSDSLLQTHQDHDDFTASLHHTFTAARRLEKWNLPAPSTLESHAAISYRAYQAIHRSVEIGPAVSAIREGLADTMGRLVSKNLKAADLRQHLGTLAALAELDDVFNASDSFELEQIVADFEARSRWMTSGRYDDVNQILSHRQTTLSMLSRKDVLRTSLITPQGARLVEVRSMLLASKIYRFQQAKHEALSISTALRALVAPSAGIGLTIEAAVKMDEAYSLWEYGEMIPSIRLLQGLHENASALKKQSVPVSHAEVLAKIGHQASFAKLETADNIQKKYLEPALKVLRGTNAGAEAGQVFHQFAVFCDEQLHDHDMLQDLARLQRLVGNKTEEVGHYKNEVSKAGNTQLRQRWQRHLDSARKYLKLDQDELEHAQKIRNEFVRLSLENFLQSLAASDDHNSDALRFTAMWLERSESEVANSAVRTYLTKVPTWKFASLMNQLSSRLQADSTDFQALLMPLVYRICCDHPFHGMWQIWAGTNARPAKHDEAALRRKDAARKVASELATNTGRTQQIWKAIDRTSYCYHALAHSALTDRNKERLRGVAKIKVSDDEMARQLQSCLSRYPIPPATMEIELRPDADYTDVPTIASLEPTISIAGGISAPRILTVVASDGSRHKQLVKGSNDDLRQDAIMEQVFASVSALLKQHRTTRQRNLGIRTYKVLPLTTNTGLIEFVDNTQPMHDWLIPAHQRYYPKDLRMSQCRKLIEEAQHQSTSARLSAYRKATDRFHPAMRYFFLEEFSDPDDWYIKRLAYTRSTAAISILGHVLGLGDRHGHNILLDKKTGEVVHIDLGVAFETGRVLPIPEVVPFRMTRDVVDGMGVTKTEGVFRRCCEFTLDALREDAHTITTILDVLRYDPLHSWSSTPLRLAKLQKAAGGGTNEEDDGNGGGDGLLGKKTVTNEPSEADRALEVVRKKLSKTLSVTATVNDLINQATDEKNLAMLYAGWAAYA